MIPGSVYKGTGRKNIGSFLWDFVWYHRWVQRWRHHWWYWRKVENFYRAVRLGKIPGSWNRVVGLTKISKASKVSLHIEVRGGRISGSGHIGLWDLEKLSWWRAFEVMMFGCLSDRMSRCRDVSPVDLEKRTLKHGVLKSFFSIVKFWMTSSEGSTMTSSLMI